MVVDSSALYAVVFREPESEKLVAKLSGAQRSGIGTPTLSEAGIVLTARIGREGLPLLGRLIDELEIAAVAFGEEHWSEAVHAFARFGRGRHEAALNFGDCLAYATAKLAGEPLLFVGDDFTRTDIERA